MFSSMTQVLQESPAYPSGAGEPSCGVQLRDAGPVSQQSPVTIVVQSCEDKGYGPPNQQSSSGQSSCSLRRSNAIRYSPAKQRLLGGVGRLRESVEARRAMMELGDLTLSTTKGSTSRSSDALYITPGQSTTPPGSPSPYAKSLIPSPPKHRPLSKFEIGRDKIFAEIPDLRDYYDIHNHTWIDAKDVRPEDEIIRESEIFQVPNICNPADIMGLIRESRRAHMLALGRITDQQPPPQRDTTWTEIELNHRVRLWLRNLETPGVGGGCEDIEEGV